LHVRLGDGTNRAFIDMGYDEPLVGFDYGGTHHSEVRDPLDTTKIALRAASARFQQP